MWPNGCSRSTYAFNWDQKPLYNVRLIPHSLSLSFLLECFFWAINFDRGDTEKWQRRRGSREGRNGRKCMNRNELWGSWTDISALAHMHKTDWRRALERRDTACNAYCLLYLAFEVKGLCSPNDKILQHYPGKWEVVMQSEIVED